MLERIPPHDEEAERATLGAMLLSWDAIDGCLEVGLKSTDFYRDLHGIIYREFCALHETGDPVDLVTAGERFRTKGQLERIGGMAYLLHLQDSAPSSYAVAHYAQIVLDRSLRRQMIMALAELTGQAFDGRQETAEDLLASAQARLGALDQGRSKATLRAFGDVASEAFGDLEKRSNELEKQAVKTGLRAFDSATGGLHPGSYYVVAARPREGKTCLLTNWFCHLAFRQGIPVALFSLEMKARALAGRIMAAEMGVPAYRIRMASLEGEDWQKITDGLARHYRAPLYIDDSRGQDIRSICIKAKQAVKRLGVRAIGVDYFQLLKVGKAESMRLGYVEASHALQELAGTCDVPVILLSQLGREVEGREGRRPRLSDLKETGALEEDPDVVAMIYHPKRQRLGGLAQLIIEKNRFGESGRIVDCWFDAEHQRFRDLRAGEAEGQRRIEENEDVLRD